MSDHTHSDTLKIEALLVRYATAIDTRQWDLFRSCFTENCNLDYGPIGHWDNREAVTQYMIQAHSGPSLHRLSNFAISVDGDRASARCYVDALVYGPKALGCANAIGYYEDTLILNAQGWQIDKRRFTAIRMKFLGLLFFIPSKLIMRLAALNARRW